MRLAKSSGTIIDLNKKDFSSLQTVMRNTTATGTYTTCLGKLNVSWLCARVLSIVGNQIGYALCDSSSVSICKFTTGKTINSLKY